MGWTEDKGVTCQTCRGPLPCRLPVELRAPRCPACQRGAHAWARVRELLGRMADRVDLTPEQQAERDRRIELYRARVERGEPVFGREGVQRGR